VPTESTKIRELRFPSGGVFRRVGFRDSADVQTVRDASGVKSDHSTPWAVNCRPEDAIANRLRGGSRPGLTKFVADPLGTSIANMVTVPTASSSGVGTVIAVLVDSTLKLVRDGDIVSPEGSLATDSGVLLCTDAGIQIVVGSNSAPASGFLVAREGAVYAVDAGGVIVMDAVTGVVSDLVASVGSVPTGCIFGAVYRDRLVLSGADNLVYMSRQGDFTDWDYGADVEDSGRALVFQLSEAGEIGFAVTALVPHQDAFLMAATSNGLWIIQGDPAASGSLRNVTRDVGMVGSKAWVKTAIGIIFLGRNDIWKVHYDGSGLENLSKNKIPDELRGLDQADCAITLGWNQDEAGVYVFLSPVPDAGHHWYFDLRQGGFWPIDLQSDHDPLAALEVDNSMVIASADGYLRSFQGSTDDGVGIESHLVIGPLPMASPASFGRLVNFHGCLGNGSGDAVWSIVTGDTAEDAVENAKKAIARYQAGNSAGAAVYVKDSGRLSAGRSHLVYPKIRAVWMAIWLRSSAQWAYEGITIETAQSGRWR